MINELSKPTSVLSREIRYLKNKILQNCIHRRKDVGRFIFLCGANQKKSWFEKLINVFLDHNNITKQRETRTVVLSQRRQEIIRFTKSFSNISILIAEKVFDILTKEKHTGNYLDVENEISKLADDIILVLESPSVFCELGAFSTKDLRMKLIVINDSKYKNQPSFINSGPLEAIKEANGNEKRIIHYNMRKNGVHRKDGISQTFAQLGDVLSSMPTMTIKAGAVSEELCNPSKSLEKDTLRFIHDLIYFLGPIAYKELIEIIKALFGPDDDYTATKTHLGLLKAMNAIKRSGSPEGYYTSQRTEPFLEYKFQTDRIMTAFRAFYLKYNLERLNEAQR